MTQDLAASGLDERLVAAAQEAGFERLSPLQEAALPVLRRGGNVVLHASSGAGVTAAWLLPLLDRLLGSEAPEGDGPRALVLVPTQDVARRVAAEGARLGARSGIAVRALAPGWRLAGAVVAVTTAERALRDVQASALKLERVQALVITDLSEQFALGHADALGTVTGLLPRESQRVVTTARLEGDVERFVEAQVRRALTVPPRAADPTEARAAEPVGQIGYLVLTESEKPELLARLLEGVEGDVTVYVRSARRGDDVRADLARRGAAADAAIGVHTFGERGGGAERTISYDVPFSADELRTVHETGGTVLVTPAELAHFMRIAAEVPFTLKQRRARVLEQDEVEAFRARIRSAMAGEDLAAQLLVLDPLLEEHSPAEVAAALSALLRQKEAAQSVGGADASPARATAAPTGSAPTGAPPQDGGAFTRLFVSIGSRDNVRPGDLVGAITGEANIRGEQVGRVDIRDTFSVVEVAAGVADRVIRALNGTTMRGRSLRVDFDRKGGGGDGGRSGPRQGPGRGGPRGAGAGGSVPPRRRPPQR